MARTRLLLLIACAMLAFAGNSLLCRLALQQTGIDPASFTTLRLGSGAAMLWLLVTLRGGGRSLGGSWPAALALFIYAAGFSFAYLSLPTGTGALILFGAVQTSMIGFGLWRGGQLGRQQLCGMTLAFAGLVGLLLPGASAPSLPGSLLMLAAGVGLALASGALASGLGYALWYAVLPLLTATTAATVQLSVPVLAALGGVLLLSEPITLRLLLAASAILGGIALTSLAKPHGRV